MSREGIEDIPDGEWEHTFRTNVFAMYYLCKAALAAPAARQRHHQHGVDPGLPALAAAAAVRQHQGRHRHFSKALAEEGAQKGIRVNVVAPGPVWTPLIPA